MKTKIKLNYESVVSLKDGFAKFINKKKAMDKSDYTISYYESRWGYFLEFLKTKEISQIEQIQEDLIDEYITYLKEKNPNISNITINNYIRAIRCILYYFMEKGFLSNFKIKLITTKNPVKEPYSLEEQKKLIQKPDLKKCTFCEYRNWVMVCHLLATGNRTRTFINIKNKDVNLTNRVILLQEVKNNLVYEVPISNEYYPILKEYMQVRGGKPDDYLFCSQYGGKLTSDGVRCIMKRYIVSHGVTRSSLHLFRHTFAKAWIMNDGSPKKLQKALGHKTPAMVDTYLSIYGKELEEDFEKYTPLSNLKEELRKEKIRIRREK